METELNWLMSLIMNPAFFIYNIRRNPSGTQKFYQHPYFNSIADGFEGLLKGNSEVMVKLSQKQPLDEKNARELILSYHSNFGDNLIEQLKLFIKFQENLPNVSEEKKMEAIKDEFRFNIDYRFIVNRMGQYIMEYFIKNNLDDSVCYFTDLNIYIVINSESDIISYEDSNVFENIEKKCLGNKKENMIMVKITLYQSPDEKSDKDIQHTTHANNLIIQKIEGIYEINRFEPHGSDSFYDSSKIDKFLISKLKDKFKHPFIYREVNETCPIRGPQTISGDSYCAAWNYYYMYLRITNPSIPAEVISKYMIKDKLKISKRVIDFILWLDNYAINNDIYEKAEIRIRYKEFKYKIEDFDKMKKNLEELGITISVPSELEKMFKVDNYVEYNKESSIYDEFIRDYDLLYYLDEISNTVTSIKNKFISVIPLINKYYPDIKKLGTNMIKFDMKRTEILENLENYKNALILLDEIIKYITNFKDLVYPTILRMFVKKLAGNLEKEIIYPKLTKLFSISPKIIDFNNLLIDLVNVMKFNDISIILKPVRDEIIRVFILYSNTKINEEEFVNEINTILERFYKEHPIFKNYNHSGHILKDPSVIAKLNRLTDKQKSSLLETLPKMANIPKVESYFSEMLENLLKGKTLQTAGVRPGLNNKKYSFKKFEIIKIC